MPTHEVTNQVPPLLGFNTAETPMIDDALRRAHVDATQLDAIHALGAFAGTAEAKNDTKKGDGTDPNATTLARPSSMRTTGQSPTSALSIPNLICTPESEPCCGDQIAKRS